MHVDKCASGRNIYETTTLLLTLFLNVVVFGFLSQLSSRSCVRAHELPVGSSLVRKKHIGLNDLRAPQKHDPLPSQMPATLGQQADAGI